MEGRQAGLLVVFVVYMLLVLGASVMASLKNLRKQRASDESSTKASGEAANQGTLEQHFLGGRSFGSIVTILTLCGTMYSGWECTALPLSSLPLITLM